MRRRFGFVILALFTIILLDAVFVGRHSARAPSDRSSRIPLAISCPTTGECWSVDNLGGASQLREGKWSPPQTVDSRALNSVSCPTVSFCIAVDTGGGYVELLGNRWTLRREIDPESAFADSELAPIAADDESIGLLGLTGVSCTSTRFCVAVDALGRAFVYNGDVWSSPEEVSRASMPSGAGFGPAMVAISCPRARSCLVVTAGGWAHPFTGSAWYAGSQLLSSASDLGAFQQRLPALGALSCATPTFCLATDYLHLSYIFDGTSWRHGGLIDTSESGLGFETSPVSCPAPSFCLAVDSLGHAVTFNGVTWSRPVTVDTALGFTGISCASRAFCVAVDRAGRTFEWNGAIWSEPYEPWQ